jgi:hypothetical protein
VELRELRDIMCHLQDLPSIVVYIFGLDLPLAARMFNESRFAR